MSVIAEDFARQLPTGEGTLHFGLDAVSVTAAMMRLLADIQSGAVLVQGVSLTGKATLDDFVTNTLSIEYTLKFPRHDR